MTEDAAEKARRIADGRPALGQFAIDMMIAAGLRLMRSAEESRLDPETKPNSARFIAATNAFHAMHRTMVAHKNNPEAVPAGDFRQACVELAAAAALLAIEGDANWPYRPEEAGE